MAISGVKSSNTLSSLLNSTNTISGLASGMDTESMIEGLVQSYQTKINQLGQKATKIEWKQDAYRSIISKMVGFSNNYTSYTSGTNLLSSSFFSNSVNVNTTGKNADKVSASGKTSSEIVLNSVSQLAAAARYSTASKIPQGDSNVIKAASDISLSGQTEQGTLSGSLTLTYGSKLVSLTFDPSKDKVTGTTAKEKADSLAKMINEKLANEQIALTSGAVDANTRIKVDVSDDGTISFSDKSSAGNSVYLSGASDSIKETLGLGDLSASSADKRVKSISVKDGTQFVHDVDNYAAISGRQMNVNLDGIVKQIKMPTIEKNEDGTFKVGDKDNIEEKNLATEFTQQLSSAFQKEFGNKIKVTNEASGTDYDGGERLQLKFEVADGSSLLLNTTNGDMLGIGSTATSYLNTGKTLGELLGEDAFKELTPSVDEDGKKIEGKYDFVLNGETIGSYGKDTKLSTIMSDINANSKAGVKVSFSQSTGRFMFTTKDTGAQAKIEFGEGLADTIFGVDESKNSADSSFTDSYGIGWLGDGDETKLKFLVPGHNIEVTVTNQSKISDVAEMLNNAFGNQGMTASYDKYSGQLVVEDKNGQRVDFSIQNNRGDPVTFDTSKAPSTSYTAGRDAILNVTINGENKDLVRSSNNFSIDGLSIALKDTFDGAKDENGNPVADINGQPANAVTFESSVDSDKIVDAIKSMITDYNEMMAEIKSAYATLPYQDSSGAFKTYEPLTDDDKADMSESAIERYEEKAKQGILFGDYNLSSLYRNMQNVFTMGGADGSLLNRMGISQSYSSVDGSMSITLDERKLREVLETDPDSVAELFTKSTDAGASSNGIMQNMKTQLDRYAGLTGATKGILIQEAGTPLSSLSLLNNNYQKQLEQINTEVESWQDKLSDRVDYYTNQFTRLELLINQMNSQSSTLAGLMGGS